MSTAISRYPSPEMLQTSGIGDFGGGWREGASNRGGGGAPSGPTLSPCKYQAAQRLQARPGQAQLPSSGAARAGVRPMRACDRAGV